MDASERPSRPMDSSGRKEDAYVARLRDERDWIDLDAPEMTAIAAA
jgi:hypothetical protein